VHEKDVRRQYAAELVPRSLSLLGISNHETGRAHQWLGAGPVAAVWPACLGLPSIVPIMAHDATLSSPKHTESHLRRIWLLPIVTDITGGDHVPKYYARFTDVIRDTINGRILNGYHFRTPDVQGEWIGKKVARWINKHYFEPVD